MMSNTIRQSNIFGNYDWKIAYDSFLEADYASYDYDTIYQSMVDYIRLNYAEDFNDYIQHSELLAHVNLLAYLGQSYAFKNDVNVIENFMDDAKRRQSIINIASSLTYRPSRNITANGYLKIMSIETTDDIVDSSGMSLQNRLISWNQKGEPTWYDSFIKILESAFKYQNKFGKPYQKNNQGNFRNEVYELNQDVSEKYVYQFTHSIDGQELSYELVPSMFDDGVMTERTPSTDDPFTIIFKNNGNGNDSSDSGFFIQFKQGELQKRDMFYTTPKIDRSELLDATNINNTDVWVQQIDENGKLLEYWYDIPEKSGQNVIYNEIDLTQRNIYFSKSLANDRVAILYGDGNFSRSPTNHMRVWFRVSANKQYTIRINDISNKRVRIPYKNREGKPQTLTVYLSNMETVDNAKISETITEIKENVIANHYQQNRMVTIEDYNVFPFQNNPLRKLRTTNRNNAGKGRFPFLDTRDPTGMHSNLFVNAVDGYIFSEYYESYRKYVTDNVVFNVNTLPLQVIEPLLQHEYSKTYYVNEVFHTEYIQHPSKYTLDDRFPRLYWKNRCIGDSNRLGNIVYQQINDLNELVWVNLNVNDEVIIREQSKLLFLYEKKEYWTTLIEIDGEIVISDYVPTNAYLYMVIPSFDTKLSDGIKEQILSLINREESFGLRYNTEYGNWNLISQNNIVNVDDTYSNNTPTSTISPDQRWLIKCIFTRDIGENYYVITSRGMRLVFGSEKQVRFFFKNTDYVDDIVTGLPSLDFVNIVQDNEDYGMAEYKPIHDEYVTTTTQDIEYLDDMD